MPGPAPDPNALRRDRKDDVGWTTLPAASRAEVAPVWPLPTASERELEMWGLTWRRPQALLWSLNGQQWEVAVFVRRSVEAEAPESPVTLGGLVQKLADALLLTIPAMHKARVKIATDEVSAKRSKPVAVARLSASDRLKARNAEVG